MEQPDTTTDVLSDVLHHVRLKSGLFCRAELSSPWSVRTAGSTAAIFHVVISGAGYVTVEGQEPVAFGAGDLIVLPHGDAHIMSDAPSARAVPISELSPQPNNGSLPTIIHGGRGARTSILCGTFRVADDCLNYLLPLFPRLLHLVGDKTETAGWLSQTMELMAAEVDRARPGANVLLDRLADILVVQVLRGLIEKGDAETQGWLGALRDPMVARTLSLIHGDPANSWTAASLARGVGISRSVFFRRFSELVGEPPGAYITRWRMRLARIALTREKLAVAAVAERVGYTSEAAFTRAFRRDVGMTPAVFRRRSARAEP